MIRSILIAALAGLLLSSVATAQQPTREQVEAFRDLPAAEQQRLMREYGRTPQQAAPISQNGTADPARPQTPSRDDDERATDTTIEPADTLIIEITGSAPEALLGRRIVVVDADGAIRLPVIDRVALAGLDARAAADRLNTEPALGGARIRVQVLPLHPTGRAALKPFGYEIFRDTAGSFAPNVTVPVPSHYTLGPGDVINVQLFGKEAATYGLEVTREGQVMFPQIGPIAVGGMSFAEAREQIAQRVQEQMIGVQASITMGPLRSIRIFVLGDAQRPGAYTVSALTTATHALFAASGVRESGSLRNIQVKRGGDTVVTLDVYDLLLRGDTGRDLRLQDGDVVFVPPAGPQVAVDGAVRRPAIYELRNEKTADELVRLAGGLKATAYAPLTRVERVDAASGERRLRTLDLTTEAGRSARLNAGDYVTVASVLERIDGMVRLTGHVHRPLVREAEQGLRVSELVGSLDNLGPHPDLDYALLARESGPERFLTVRSVRLGQALANPGTNADPVLAANDELIVFGLDQTDERRARVDGILETLRLQASATEPARIVTISGPVRASGPYPLEAGMNQADLIRAGGGLTEAASDLDAEISRVEITAADEFRITHFRTDLAAEVRLQSRDTLHIKPKPYWAERRVIELRGEVRYPGDYTVHRNERLSQVIERAGGPTPEAYPRGAVFMRESLRAKEQEQIDLMADRLQIDIATARTGQEEAVPQQVAAAQALAAQLRNTRAAGRLVIDLPQAIRNSGDPELDIDLNDGDILVIPKRPQEVTIVGEVHYATSHFWEQGRDLDAYLDLSGGTTNRADRKAIYLVRANGAVELANSGRFGRGNARIQPGDTIIVPIDTDRVPTLTLWTNVSQIIYQIGVAAAAWNSVGVF